VTTRHRGAHRFSLWRPGKTGKKAAEREIAPLFFFMSARMEPIGAKWRPASPVSHETEAVEQVSAGNLKARRSENTGFYGHILVNKGNYSGGIIHGEDCIA